jgi:Zn-dependent metalloprotease
MRSVNPRVSRMPAWLWLGVAALSANALLASMVLVPRLSEPVRVSPDPQAITDPRSAFAALQGALGAPIDVQWDAVHGTPSWLFPQDLTQRLPYQPTAAERGNPSALAFGFLDANRTLFNLTSASAQFRLLRIEVDAAEFSDAAHVRLQQMHEGVPVHGGQLIVHVAGDDGVLGVNGRYRPAIQLISSVPNISKDAAEEIALRHLRESALDVDERDTARPRVLSDRTELVVYVDQAEKATLAWRVRVLNTRPLGSWNIFVNARKAGAVAQATEQGGTLKRRVTYTAQGTSEIPGWKLADEGEIPRDAIARAAHEGAGKVYDYFFNNFKRDSIDGRGMPLVSTVNWGESPQEQENAAWIGEENQMVYGNGGRTFRPLATGLDVVGHEFTHGVINTTADLVYEAQSGALNESFADVFGVLISGSNWEVGRGVVKSPPFPVPYLRSLSDPNANGFYNPRNPLAGVGQPATMEQYANLPVSRRADNGGVHINSGIPNFAAYKVGTALGRDKTGQIWYRALTNYMGPRSRFTDAATATIRAAQELYGATDAETVRNAWASVGIGGQASSEPAQQQGKPKPSGSDAGSTAVPAGCTNVLQNGGFENESNWKQLTQSGSGIIESENPRSGVGAAWLGGTDQENSQGIYQDITIPANATKVTFSYYRWANQEFSGLFSAFLNSPATFQAVIANPNSRARAELDTLTSDRATQTYERQEFDVSTLAGRTVRILFASENPRGNVSSFFVDDVAVIACTTGTSGSSVPPVPAPAAATQVYVAGGIVDADTGRGVAGATIFILKPGVTAAQAGADNRISDDEVQTTATSDARGAFQTKAPLPAGTSYSVIIVARGYRPVVAEGGLQVPRGASNPHTTQVQMRRSF